MGMYSPGTILKLWTRMVHKLEDGKKPADLPKKGNQQKLKIKNSLTKLKLEAPAAKTNPDPFIDKRDRSALLLRKFCRYLKTAKDEDRKLAQKYLKTVMGLAVVVQNLDPGGLDLNEEEGSLEALDALDTTALAAALEKPDTEPDDADGPMPDDIAPGTSATAPTPPARKEQEKAKPSPPVNDPAAQFQAKLAAWTPAIKGAMAAKGPNASAIARLLADATALSKAGNMAQALAKLTECHTLATATAPPASQPKAPAGQPKAAADPAAEFQAKLAAWTPAIKAAMAAKGPNAPAIARVLAEATALSKSGNMAQALARLTECHTLATGGPAPAQNLADVAKLWRAARDQVTADLEAFRKALLAKPDIASDQRFSFVRSAAAEIPNMLPRTAALNAGLASGDTAKVQVAIDKYRKDLAAAGNFARLEAYATSKLGLKLAAREKLTTAMADMETSLKTTP